jgi:hypothetical protein
MISVIRSIKGRFGSVGRTVTKPAIPHMLLSLQQVTQAGLGATKAPPVSHNTKTLDELTIK